MRLLLVEDDPMIAVEVCVALRQQGFAVDPVATGEQADTALRGHAYDLVLLDLGLPGMDGLEVLRALRQRQDTVPVLILTARDSVGQRVAGLDAGADDYLPKPFDLDELTARIRALLRRVAGRAGTVLTFGALQIDVNRREVRLEDETIHLSAREWAVLQALCSRPGQVFSRAQIEEKLYAWGDEVSSNTVEVYIHGLRRKLGSDRILNIRGIGYRLVERSDTGR